MVFWVILGQKTAYFESKMVFFGQNQIGMKFSKYNQFLGEFQLTRLSSSQFGKILTLTLLIIKVEPNQQFVPSNTVFCSTQYIHHYRPDQRIHLYKKIKGLIIVEFLLQENVQPENNQKPVGIGTVK